MFETAELGRKISKRQYAEREPLLRQQLLEAQGLLRESESRVIVMIAGVDGAGKSETANLLNAWMDPRRINTHAFSEPSQEEAERPEFWRYWRELPPRGKMGLFLSAWYHDPVLDHAYGKIDRGQLDARLDKIVAFERMLAVDGALVLKFWLHLDREAQRRRFRKLEKDPLQKWRVTKQDWKNWRRYDKFVDTAEHVITRTSTGEAPWRIVEGTDFRYLSLEVGSRLLAGLHRWLASRDNGDEVAPGDDLAEASSVPTVARQIEAPTVLSALDLNKTLERNKYQVKRDKYQARLNLLHRRMHDEGVSSVVVFEGWDAAGKGGAIRRVTSALDARNYDVVSIAAPTEDESAHHYLWRFWRHVPGAGRVTLFDRSWYGRVLVERIEGFADEEAWRRSYAEINDFESQLVDHGIVVVKFWIEITSEEQKSRFDARAKTPHKRWKLTDEDWRNRAKREAYTEAVHDMVERTSTTNAAWHLIEGNDKRYARVKVLRTVCREFDKRLQPPD
ncbi:MAG: polyphosphate:AMP phosphotransferase [bacterium]|nr:polyphosphate:AMP phosphotransferase [bacterium]